MLNRLEFEILKYIDKQPGDSAEEISKVIGLSLDKTEQIISELKERNFADEKLSLTQNGEAALEPYRVKNAVIMAAGLASRFAPLSYEIPKGLLNVKGEILIERQIHQLKEAGINDITIVVGYMKEKFAYLAQKENVHIIENNDYRKFNNTSTLMLVADILDNTYICSSDDYFSENVFEKYVYSAYYAAVYSDSETEEYCLDTDENGIIRGVTIGGGPDTWFMLGHAYFSREFSRKFVPMLQAEFEERASVRENLWEKFYMQHLDELHMEIRKYPHGVIYEFDSLEELRAFDSKYIDDTGSVIFGNICRCLECRESEIVKIIPLKGNSENLSFKFTVRDRDYIYAMDEAQEKGWLLTDANGGKVC